jgi:hypothetical protein
MLLGETTDKIQFRLTASAATQLPFVVHYNNYTSSAVTLNSNNGTSNNTTLVDLVPSPSASEQNQLRYCSISNPNASTVNVAVLNTYGSTGATAFFSQLKSGGVLQYQLEKGWETLDGIGNKSNSAIEGVYPSVRGNVGYRPGATTVASATTTGVWYVVGLGRAEFAYTQIITNWAIAAVGSGAVTYAEVAIYAGELLRDYDGITLTNRLGVTSVAADVTSAGAKSTTISVTGIVPGTKLFWVYSNSLATTQPTLRMISADAIGGGVGFQTTALVSGGRPSLVPSGIINTGTANTIWVNWQGT